jgi:hypothetical protein
MTQDMDCSFYERKQFLTDMPQTTLLNLTQPSWG